MDIDEFAHALGVIFGGAPLGDLDVAPGPLDVDADERLTVPLRLSPTTARALRAKLFLS
jgi:hypothetical protein